MKTLTLLALIIGLTNNTAAEPSLTLSMDSIGCSKDQCTYTFTAVVKDVPTDNQWSVSLSLCDDAGNVLVNWRRSSDIYPKLFVREGNTITFQESRTFSKAILEKWVSGYHITVESKKMLTP